MFEIEPLLSADLILENLTQEEIFEYYLGIPVSKGFFTSPLRDDKNPTCSFSWFRGKLYFRDWSESKPKDCFNIVQEIYNVDYFGALMQIKKDLLEGKHLKVPRKQPKSIRYKEKEEKVKINVKIAPFTKENLEYFSQYNIGKQQLVKFKVFSIKRYWINDSLKWTYKVNDPCIAYYFGKAENNEQRWKLYHYRRNKRETIRFIGNTNRINGWIQLPKKDELVIITKSMKDVMTLDSLGYNAIAMQSEHTIPYDYIIEELEERFDRIISFYDYDNAGRKNSNTLKKLYDIEPIYLTNGENETFNYEAKDISDFVSLKGRERAKEFLRENTKI